jgi:hypothetical protein
MPETASFIPRRAEAMALQGFGAWLLAGFFLLSTREETNVQASSHAWFTVRTLDWAFNSPFSLA